MFLEDLSWRGVESGSERVEAKNPLGAGEQSVPKNMVAKTGLGYRLKERLREQEEFGDPFAHLFFPTIKREIIIVIAVAHKPIFTLLFYFLFFNQISHLFFTAVL